MTGRLEWPDPTPYGPTAEEEAIMEEQEREARECQRCGGAGRVEAFACDGVCNCGMCPSLEDCPECVGQIEIDAPAPSLEQFSEDLAG